ncbi:MAG: nucleoside 2-deoxyribosyltransferase domain-containing protein [Erysipelotrichaceae bacterium]|nr:nucleoside 2-deoxyribosyltransferase domain-containing protein [Erysipelotrichaceae bacterium]MBQ5444056.1 nucleoside 2-deoxyribosyltransferase domain-containing protein [Erysipelotrichaceae bacterium]
MKVYIAAPLYCEQELKYNLKIDTFLRENGFDTYLPQRDGGVVSEMPEIVEGMPKGEYVFQKDLEAMKKSDVFLFLLDGRVPDEGACVALGYFYSSGKPCVGLKTDTRNLVGGEDNLMIRMALKKICRTKEELLEYLKGC